MSAAPFDPVAFISDMHDIGAALEPYTDHAGARVFRVAGELGVPGDVPNIAARWDAAARAYPDWLAAVHDALIARRGGL